MNKLKKKLILKLFKFTSHLLLLLCGLTMCCLLFHHSAAICKYKFKPLCG